MLPWQDGEGGYVNPVHTAADGAKVKEEDDQEDKASVASSENDGDAPIVVIQGQQHPSSTLSFNRLSLHFLISV